MGVWNPGSAATSGADTYTGTANAEIVDGLAGNDTFNMFGGDDQVVGGDGADNISGDDGADTLYGDRLFVGIQTGSFSDTISGGAGDDVIAGGSGVDALSGGDGDDLVFSGRASFVAGTDTDAEYEKTDGGYDIMDGGAGEDVAILALRNETAAILFTLGAPSATTTYTVGGATVGSLTGFESVVIHSGSGADVLQGGVTFDLLDGGVGNDTLYGQAGDDLFVVSAGDDLYFGGDGDDALDLSEISTGATVDLGSTARQSAGTRFFTLSSIEHIDSGGSGADHFIGTAIGQYISGGAGDDLIEGLGGNDELEGDEGADTLLGGAGNDDLWIDADDAARGGADNDTYHLYDPASVGAIEELAGEGVDTVQFYSEVIAPGTITVSIENVANVERVVVDYGGVINLTGNGLSNELVGNHLANTLIGLGGNDTLDGALNDDILLGGMGDDVLYGRDGNDALAGQEGNDLLDGGLGSDTAVYAIATSAVTVSLAVSGAQATGGAGSDTLIGIENLLGSAFADTLTGDGVRNFITAGAGDDFVAGGGGNDELSGGLGEDQLYGQTGNDVLRDGGETTNRDFLYGGSGNDTYYVTSSLTGPTDVVFEGGSNPDLMPGIGDIDTIHSEGQFFWDFYGVAETLFIDRTAGSQLVGGTNNQTFWGNVGSDQMIAYGGTNRVDAGAGTDAISFGLYGLPESADGVNTLVMKAGNGLDYVYEFESGVDKIDLTAFNFGITGAQVLAQAVNVDNAGTADDYCYFYLTNAGGVDNYVAFIGLLSSQLQASDFIT